MRIYALLANDKKNSLSETSLNKVMNELKRQGHEIDFLDLYSRYNDIPFYFSKKNEPSSNYPTLESFPFFEENKKRFMAADRLILAYPIYWYSTPGIMKCWIDLITNFAWKYEGGRFAKPLHKIKKSLILTTSSSPTWYLKFLLLNCSFKPVIETFKWMGITENHHYNIGNVYNISQEKIEEHENKIVYLSQKLI